MFEEDILDAIVIKSSYEIVEIVLNIISTNSEIKIIVLNKK